ncbi:hypothetical protein [Aeribacillus composti]|uniref:hypothetical protein n=1 Tax=Aeribacillus composti TaxID=1868734 RepID=UPI002E1E8F7F|nr:hypothetical protein [Aeribacillus composti]
MADEKVIQDQQLDKQQEDTLEAVSKEEYDKLLAELEEVKAKLPKEPTEEEKALQAKQQELWQKEVSLSLKEAGLEKFADIIKVSNEDELNDVVKKLTDIINEIKIETGYVPADHKQMSAYEQAKKQGNTKNMIKALFGMNN